MNPKKEKLIELSVKARAIREELGEERTINSIIIEYFYTDEKNTEFNKYKEWLELGYQVKKGAKAFCVWGKKRTNKKQEVAEGEEQDEYKFFPLAYLFSNAQVEKIKEVA